MSDEIKEDVTPVEEEHPEVPLADDEYFGEWQEPTLKERIVRWFKNALQYTAFGNIGNTREFSEFEYKMAYKIIEMYSDYDNKISSWLFYYIDIKKFTLRWSVSSNAVGIQGSYNPALWRTMTLSDSGFFALHPKGGFIPEDTSCIVHKTLKGTYRTNTGVLSTFLVNFPTFIHEITHAFQFGLPCSMPSDSTWKDWLLIKVVLPIGYVFNRLVTLFIDNPLIDAILHKWDDKTGKSMNIDYNADKVHLPWLYKITLEHDVDTTIEDNKRLHEFCENLNKALGAYEFARNSDPRNHRNAHNFVNRSEEDIANAIERADNQIQYIIDDYGEWFLNKAKELYTMFEEEGDRLIAIDKQKNK